MAVSTLQMGGCVPDGSAADSTEQREGPRERAVLITLLATGEWSFSKRNRSALVRADLAQKQAGLWK